MDTRNLMEMLCRDGGSQPDKAEVFSVRAYSSQDHERRLKRLLSAAATACQRSFERGDWTRDRQRTLVRLPAGGRAEVFHASGAMRVVSGLRPMDALFDRVEPREKLETMVRKIADSLRLESWFGDRSRIEFERLWQIKAGAVDRKGTTIDPVLCRAIGAYRQFVGRLPVLGGASAAVKVASGGLVDSISIQLLEIEAQPVASASLVSPEEAANAISLQFESLMGEPENKDRKIKISAQPLQLGYLHLGKRKAQRVLAPHYIAEIELEHEEAQAMLLVAPATRKIYQPLCLAGQDSPLSKQRHPVAVSQTTVGVQPERCLT